MSHETITDAVPSYGSVEAMAEVLTTKGTHDAYGMYPTDGTASVIELEKRLGVLEGMSQREVVAYHAGMSAVEDAIDTALHLASQRGQHPKIAKPEQSYSQTDVYITKYLTRRGVRVCCYDSGDPEDVAYVLEEDKPQVFLSETVSNGPRMPVLDHEHLLRTVRNIDEKQRPVVILDNTLPLSTGLPIGQELSDEDRVVIVNSGMKMISLNSEMLGYSYSRNEELLKELREYRITRRTIPSVTATEQLLSVVPEVDTYAAQEAAKGAFDQRNARIFANSKRLAEIIFQAEQDGAPFQVVHPNIGEHPNRAYVEQYFEDGVAPAPVLYLHSHPDKISHIELAKKLFDKNDAVKQGVELRQSFGFDEASFLFSLDAPVIRIAAGANTDVDALGSALYEAATATT